MVAPREPRMASGFAGALAEFHKTPFGSRLIKGTVADAAGAEETVDPVAVAVDVFVDKDIDLTSEEEAGIWDDTAGGSDEVAEAAETEAIPEAEGVTAGAAKTVAESRRARVQEEMLIMLIHLGERWILVCDWWCFNSGNSEPFIHEKLLQREPILPVSPEHIWVENFRLVWQKLAVFH